MRAVIPSLTFLRGIYSKIYMEKSKTGMSGSKRGIFFSFWFPLFWPLIVIPDSIYLILDTNYSLLILIPGLAIPDPEAIIPDNRVVIPDPLYLVTTLTRSTTNVSHTFCMSVSLYNPMVSRQAHKRISIL